MNEQLLPCPFCGSKAKLHDYFYLSEDRAMFWVACTNCGVDTHAGDGSPEAAITAWNQRADDTIASLKTELAAALGDIIAYRRSRYADSALEEVRYRELTGHSYDDEDGGA